MNHWPAFIIPGPKRYYGNTLQCDHILVCISKFYSPWKCFGVFPFTGAA
jgi:hypothetical protein